MCWWQQKRPRPEPQPAEPLEELSEEDLAAALAVLQSETVHVRRAMGHEQVPEEEYMETWAAISRDFIYLPSRQRYDRSNSATNSDRLASLQASMLGCQWHVNELFALCLPGVPELGLSVACQMSSFPFAIKKSLKTGGQWRSRHVMELLPFCFQGLPYFFPNVASVI